MSATAAPSLLLRELASWAANGSMPDFPYDAVITCYRTHGKHFVPEELLEALAGIRLNLAPARPGDEDRALLDAFLAVALDKWDDRYDYRSYLGIDLLGLIPEADGVTARWQRDEWVRLLLSDIWMFESLARDGKHDLLPEQRPDADLSERRLRLLEGVIRATPGSFAAASAADEPAAEEPIADVVRRLIDKAPARRRLELLLSMQPVHVVHDEYLFIRILQSFEVTFTAMAADMRDALGAVRGGSAETAAASIRRCGRSLAAARSYFTLLATMRAESFRTFRTYTVGASAIQSGSYKIFEALCAVPPRSRVDSPAFEAVPQVRDRLDNGWDDLTSGLRAAAGAGTLSEDGIAVVKSAAAELEEVHQRWKQTHWRMAVRMIGEERGTGYTVGVPYLKKAIDNRLFPELLGADEVAG